MYCVVCKMPERRFLSCESNIALVPRDEVIVALEEGVFFLASVVAVMSLLSVQEAVLCSVVRKATEQDVVRDNLAKEKAEMALQFCKTLVEKLRLPMKVFHAELLPSFRKYVFYYTAPGRVDFRPLLSLLTSKMKENIELRQVGIRNAIQMSGDIGICGQPCCCSRYMREFHTVSAKTVKRCCGKSTFGAKTVGMCGRLICCSSFEEESHTEDM